MRVLPRLGLLALALTGCNEKNNAANATARGAGPSAVAVEVVIARSDTVTDAISATGQIEAVQSIELRPDVDGRISEILVREGARVAQGTPLFRIDDVERKAEVARASADRDLAQQALTRTKDLIRQNAASQSDLERAEATARSTQAALDILTIRLERSVVRAPFAGVVGQRFVSLGDFVTSASRLAALQTTDPQRASLQVPERYSQQLRVGQMVAFRVAAIPGKEFAGRVEFVDPSVQLPARTITIKAVVANPGNVLHAGMFLEARLATQVRQNATVIPEDAVQPLQGKRFVWVVADAKATRREVTLGLRTPGYVEIVEGVSPGDHVVVAGADRLNEGAPVEAKVVDRTPVRPTESR